MLLPNCSKTGALYIKMIAISVDQIIVNFLHKSFPVIDVEPDYHITHYMWTLLYVNAHILTTILGGGNHGHIGIVTQDMLYGTISPTPYFALVDLGVTATVTPQAITAQLSKLQDEHDEARRIHENYYNVDADLKTMVLYEVDNTYVFFCIMSSGDTLVINKIYYEPSDGLISNNNGIKHIDDKNIPSITIGHFTTNIYLLQYH